MSWSMARRTQTERREASKRQLIEAAMVLFGQQGYAGTTLRDVGERAGVSAALATYHFGSKEALFRAVLDAIREQARRYGTEIGADRHRGLGAVEALVDYYLRGYAEKGTPERPEAGRDLGRTVFVAAAEAISATPELRDVVAEHDEAVRGQLRRCLEQAVDDAELPSGTDVDAVAVAIAGLMRGVALQWLVNPAAVDFDAVMGVVRTMTSAFPGGESPAPPTQNPV